MPRLGKTERVNALTPWLHREERGVKGWNTRTRRALIGQLEVAAEMGKAHSSRGCAWP